MPVHDMARSAKPAGGTACCRNVVLRVTASSLVGPDSPWPATVVTMGLTGAASLVPVNAKEPTPPFETTVVVTRGGISGGVR